LEKKDIFVNQSDYYIDSDTGKLREVDVLASTYGYGANDALEFELEVNFCIQCKLSKDKPWIVFSPKRQGSGFLSPILSESSEAYWQYVCRKVAPVKGRFVLSTMIEGPVCYGVTMAFTSGKDVAYEAIMGAVKAAVWKAIQADDISSPGKSIFGTVNFPVVVFDGRLFRCWLDDSDEVAVLETDSAVLYQPFRLTSQTRWITIQIFTRKMVDGLVKDALTLGNTLSENITDWLAEAAMSRS
jgi:hypothetical protein